MSFPANSTAPTRRRFTATVGGALSVLLAASFITAGPAQAAPGSAPEPVTLTRIGDVHTDAISTFFDDGGLVLASKADTPALATRYGSDEVFFHVDDDSRVASWPTAAPSFVSPVGSTVWLAAQTQAPNQIWPGFSTESVPRGTLVDDSTTFTLEDVDGPGDVELWQTGSFGSTTRLWSSDEDVKTFARGNVHMHANWAFTQPGTYRMTVRADAVASATEAAVSDTATYTFVVGDLPEDVDTTTTLAASATGVNDGDPVTLTSTVSPAGVEGAVEFRDGSTVVGHDKVDGAGSAELDVPDLAAGSHSITAVFVPAVENFANTSTSAPVTVTVTDSSGEPFSVRGMASSYEPGATMSLRVVGVTPKENQEIRWKMRYQGTGTSSVIVPTPRTTTYSQQVDANHDDAEVQATLYDQTAKATLSETAWVPVDIEHSGGQPAIEQVGAAADPLYPGDSVDYRLTGRELGEGETVVWGFASYGGYFAPSLTASRWPATYPAEDRSSIHLTSRYNPTATGRYATPLVASVMKNGIAISRTAFSFINTGRRELNVTGARTVYREGGRVTLDATTYPLRDADELTYTWTFSKRVGDTTTTEVWGTDKQATPALDGPALNKAQHDGGSLSLTLFNDGVQAQTSTAIPIKVTDDLNSQLLEFSALAAHYHQGDALRLSLTADPEPIAGDTLEWQWKWPGAEWETMPGVEGNEWRAAAEQGLHDLQIRAVITWADATREPLVSDTRVILVDDHGGAARQKPTVSGSTEYTAGQTVTLRRELPDNGNTILTTHLWERKPAGAEQWKAIEDETRAELSFQATSADDGAQYRVSILKPTGEPAYGPSPDVQLSVAEAPVTPTPVAPTTISAANVTQTYGKAARLSIAVEPEATGTVRVAIGAKTVSAVLSGGRAAVTIPAKGLAPGTRSVTVSYAGAPGKHAPSSRIVRVTVRKASPKVRVKLSSSKVARGRTATFVVTTIATGVRPTGRVTVRVAGTSKTVRLNSKGKAVVRIKIGTKVSAGKRTVTARYNGSTYVAAAKAPAVKVNVRR